MKTKMKSALLLSIVLAVLGVLTTAQQSGASSNIAPPRPKGPCDIYEASGNPCVAAHSTTRALYSSYNGPLYQVLRQSDGKTLDIGVAQPVASPVTDAGGYADAAAQDAFCAKTYCWISKIYDQSPKHNDLTQAPRGTFSGPAMGGFNNLPLADMAPISIMGHKVYGIFIAPGTGLRNNTPTGTAVDDQAEGQYWVINGQHFNSACCFDYGNAEIDSRDDDNGTMEATYYGDTVGWYHGNPPGPWIMTDQENNLVGCVNADGSKLCANLPNVTWRFVSAIAKGEPHHWTSLGGDAQKGPLQVFFDGPRIDASYDPMRKQGAILLGNGGDNSNGSQGTFYEGAMTAAGTFPKDDTDQLVQANIVAARYDVSPLTLAPSSATTNPPGRQTFSPGSSQDTTVTFTNTTGAPAAKVVLSISAPSAQWTTFVSGTTETSKTFAGPIAPGASISASFKVTSGKTLLNGDLVGKAVWTNQTTGRPQSERAVEKVRNVSPIKINEFRIGSTVTNSTDSFIELFNAGTQSVDLSNWTLTERPTQHVDFSTISIPAGTKLAAGGFYLLGLSNSGLASPAHAGDSIVHVRSTTGMSVGDTISIDVDGTTETRKIAKLGTAAGIYTPLWQPVPDGLVTVPAGSTNVPVTSTAGFAVGEKIALGYGATYPVVAKDGLEKYEVVTVTTVGKPGTQAYLAVDAPAGTSNIKVTALNNISVGDKIRLDIDSVGHGIETVTVAHIGTHAEQTNLAHGTAAGATNVKVRGVDGFVVGDRITVGTPASMETVTVTGVGTSGSNGTGIDIKPALTKVHVRDEWVVSPGTGLDLAAPLRFSHAANLPFSAQGTGISFQPATAFAHTSNEPIQSLGSGIVLDKPLGKDHPIFAPVRDAAVTNAGYQGTPLPNQWFGGPEFATIAPFYGHTEPLALREGSMVLRDASGLVVDSLNYGSLVDSWLGEGYQTLSGSGKSGCHVVSPGLSVISWPSNAGVAVSNSSAGRFPDGADTDSNCTDFLTQTAATLSASSAGGATNIKVGSVAGFAVGQKIMVDAGTNFETAVISTVGTAGATTMNSAIDTGSTVIPVANVTGFSNGQTVTIDGGSATETAVIASIHGRGNSTITVASPLVHAHAAGAQVSGTGITLDSALTRAHAIGAEISNNLPTPGAPNRYYKK